MFITNAQQVRDYRLCKYLYNARHNMKKPERSGPVRDKMKDSFDEAMRKLVKRAYFHTMGDNGFPTMDRLLYEWDRIWHDGRTIDSIIEDQNTPGKSIDSFNTDAIRMIKSFYKTHSKNPGRVAGILGEDYFVQLDSGAVITGNIDLVVERNGQLIIPHYTTKSPSYFKYGTIGHTKVILDAVAFRHKTGRLENLSTIEYLDRNKPEPIVVTDVAAQEIEELIAEMATQTRWAASPGCYWCDRCTWKNECTEW